ncbi:hypothetical protein SPFM15_00165 [Salmonella phage SPFM15]|nr:hypothetical protein SPFM5_00160 [Salmonella phage SPFM5]VFR13789.1 hypothetical protein SPFM15_00165 [Salmonella phage SPFM15]
MAVGSNWEEVQVMEKPGLDEALEVCRDTAKEIAVRQGSVFLECAKTFNGPQKTTFNDSPMVAHAADKPLLLDQDVYEPISTYGETMKKVLVLLGALVVWEDCLHPIFRCCGRRNPTLCD